jgi:ABC-type oligopeptide transport system substrate-binding subunit
MEEAFAIKDDPAARAAKLHEAESMILSDMPVIPIIFNQNAYIISGDLSKNESSYYGFRVFNRLALKDYIQYIETEAPVEEEE